MSADVLLQARGVSLRFGGLQALDKVSLSVRRGEIFGLIGPNGAGKTSFFNVLTGLYRPHQGQIELAGQVLPWGQPHAIARAGLARTFQNIRLFASMTALEHVMVGQHARTRAGVLGAVLRTAATRAEEAAIARRAHALLEYVGLGARSQERAGHLSYGEQRRLEIARALATAPQLLALDEPAAGMNETETAQMRTLIETVRADGISVLLIEHDMHLVMNVCDRIAVLDHGTLIAEDQPAAVQRHPRVIQAYLGDELEHG